VGENQNQPFQLSFNPSLRVDFQGSRVTSDGGLVLARELDERLGFSDLIAPAAPDDKIASQCREQARRVYYGCVFKAKKEIPDDN